MNKDEIRNKIQNNFLKNLIFRIDFSGMMDADVETFIQKIRPQLLKRDYVTLREEYGNNINFNVLAPDNIQTNTETTKTYVFNSKQGKELKISKSFVIFEINMERNETLFSNYIPLISIILDELKNLQYVQFNRIGLRKVNVCLLLNKKYLNDYFKQNVLCRFNDNSPTTQVADEFFLQQYRVNYNRRFQEGKFLDDGKEKVGYQIILDIDSYMQGVEVVDKKIKEENSNLILAKLNDIIFNIYIDSLTTAFNENLEKDKYIDANIRGVIKNG